MALWGNHSSGKWSRIYGYLVLNVSRLSAVSSLRVECPKEMSESRNSWIQNKGATDGWLSGKVRQIGKDKKQQLAEWKEITGGETEQFPPLDWVKLSSQPYCSLCSTTVACLMGEETCNNITVLYENRTLRRPGTRIRWGEIRHEGQI